jgi:hypothetical protein
VEQPRVRAQRSEWFPADDLFGNGVDRLQPHRPHQIDDAAIAAEDVAGGVQRRSLSFGGTDENPSRPAKRE